MKRHHQSRKLLRFLSLIIITMILAILAVIPIRIALTQLHTPTPQAIFMLSGNPDRERFTVKFAQEHPQLPIWVSTASSRIRQTFKEANLDPNRLHYDDRATDTVTNFTTMVEPLQNHNIHHVYLITSDYHMRRSRAIGTIVFGSRSIILTPLPVNSKRSPEPITEVVRDVGRSVAWLFTGRTGASLKGRVLIINYDQISLLQLIIPSKC